ncbi:MAG: ATP-binding cassette domain-containing protein [Deltaproteobacteria bacterium]|nr:ATP-binding cassette domain-containing protein [Deltaproteobacteria bacterium]
MIEVKNLTKMYGDICAVDDVTFEVHRGEVLGFLGPNGAGKTTTMKILTCFIAPTKGRATVAGSDILNNSLEIRRRIGYLPENAPLYVDMQVNEYLDFVADIRSVSGSDKAKALDRVVGVCGLGDVASREIRALSKGYRQRVGLAQAMIHDPSILILDEPTSGLDPNQIVEIRELIKSIGKERTVILSTHNLAEVQATAGRVIIINKGHLVADGSLNELEADRGGARYDVVLDNPEGGTDGVREAFSAIDGVKGVEFPGIAKEGEVAVIVRGEGDKDVRADIFRAAVDKSWVLLGLGRKQVDLESIFRQLTKAENKPSAPKN